MIIEWKAKLFRKITIGFDFGWFKYDNTRFGVTVFEVSEKTLYLAEIFVLKFSLSIYIGLETK